MIDLPITDTTCGAIFVGWKVLKVWHEAYLHIYVLLSSLEQWNGEGFFDM